MNLNSNLKLDFGDLNNFYFSLLSNEDFDFKTKNIQINISQSVDNIIIINFNTTSIIDMKIASSSLIKSLEIIDKTLNTVKNDL